MAERYYGRLDSERGWLDRIDDKTTGLSMRVVTVWGDGRVVTVFVPDRRALPLDGPDIGSDVPGGGAV